MKRYDSRHDEHWFLGISAYQWTHGVAPITLLGLMAGGWQGGLLTFAFCYVAAWTAWVLQ